MTVEDVIKLLRRLNLRKACGLDLLQTRILKDLADEIAPLLTTVFQVSFRDGQVPKDWKTANVSAIFKKGDKFKASNYCPLVITLTSLCCKIQEHIITSNILKHLEEHNIQTDCQHGFRARRSCETHLLTLAQELISGLDKTHQHDDADLIILDFSKAFDQVLHQRLLKPLKHHRISVNTLKRIRAFLIDRSQQVIIEGTTSDSVPMFSGVFQGTVLGPLLFLISITVQTSTRLFADD